MGEDMCENCVTPWKCNGPHTPAEENEVTGSSYRLVKVSLTVEVFDPDLAEPTTVLTERATLGGVVPEKAGIAAQSLIETLAERQRRALDG